MRIAGKKVSISQRSQEESRPPQVLDRVFSLLVLLAIDHPIELLIVRKSWYNTVTDIGLREAIRSDLYPLSWYWQSQSVVFVLAKRIP